MKSMETAAKQSLYEAKKVDYFTLIWMIIVHILAVTALFHFSWSGLGVFLLLHFVTGCLGITFCFHRLLSHRSLQAHPVLEAFTAFCGTLALQGTVVEWVAHHRLHHRASDTDRDPHNARRGFWYSHMQWLFQSHNLEARAALLANYGSDLMAKPWLAFLAKPSVMIASQVALGLLLLAIGGASWVYWGVFVRLAFVYHTTWLVNSATHKWGYRTFPSKDLAVNNWWVALLTWGEGWHNNHHRFPNVCPTWYRWWEVDVTYVLVKIFAKCGWVSHVRTFPKEASRPSPRPTPAAPAASPDSGDARHIVAPCS